MANPDPIRMLRASWVSSTTRKKVIFEFAGERVEDLDHIAQLIASGKLRTVIDKRYSLDQIQEAHEYVGNGMKKGSVIILVEKPR